VEIWLALVDHIARESIIDWEKWKYQFLEIFLETLGLGFYEPFIGHFDYFVSSLKYARWLSGLALTGVRIEFNP